jgi:hypothetical protein
MKYILRGICIGLAIGLAWFLLGVIVDEQVRLIYLLYPILLCAIISIISLPLLTSKLPPWMVHGGIGAITYIVVSIASFITERTVCGTQGMCGLASGWVIAVGWLVIPLMLLIPLIAEVNKYTKITGWICIFLGAFKILQSIFFGYMQAGGINFGVTDNVLAIILLVIGLIMVIRNMRSGGIDEIDQKQS